MRNLFRLGALTLLAQMSFGLATPVLAHHSEYEPEDKYEYEDLKSDNGGGGNEILYGVGGLVIGGVVGYIIGEKEGVRKTERKYADIMNNAPKVHEMPPQVRPQASHPPEVHVEVAPTPRPRVKVVPPQPTNPEGCIVVKEGNKIFCPVPAGQH